MPSISGGIFIFGNMKRAAPIGVFDSGYGGLTVLKEIVEILPDYDYLYLGDNARAPYGIRSFETVYEYTLQCVSWLFQEGCPLIILACNTASAKALRSIQQNNLASFGPDKKVLGVIRPTVEIIGEKTESNKVGILGTRGTVQSESYPLEIKKFFPEISVYQQACPMWVPLVENNEISSPGAHFFVQQDLKKLKDQDPGIDTILLACTHYPLLEDVISEHLPPNTQVISQGKIVAQSLADYLTRHPEIEKQCSRNGIRNFVTTDSTADFDQHATIFFGDRIQSRHLDLTTK